MVGPATQLDDVMADRGDRVDDADRQPFVLEDRALLDVELDPGVEVVALRLRDPLRIEPDRPHRLADRGALAVADLLGLLLREPADNRARAPEVGRVEAAGFLLAQ